MGVGGDEQKQAGGWWKPTRIDGEDDGGVEGCSWWGFVVHGGVDGDGVAGAKEGEGGMACRR
jgi:hypothetical protein